MRVARATRAERRVTEVRHRMTKSLFLSTFDGYVCPFSCIVPSAGPGQGVLNQSLEANVIAPAPANQLRLDIFGNLFSRLYGEIYWSN